VRDASLQNVVDSSLQATQAPDLSSNDSSNEDGIEVTKYFTMNVTSKRSSPWWEGFEKFIPSKHPTLYKEYVLCKECSTFNKNSDKGIVKVGWSQSTSNLRAHKRHHHPAEYETIAKHIDKTTCSI
jgi:hypothetical protein